MERLSDVELLEAYLRAKELDCSPEFIQLLFKELEKRSTIKSQNEFSSTLNQLNTSS